MTDFVTPYYLEKGIPILPALNIPAENIGYAGYDISSGPKASDKFLKYQLYYNGLLKSMPLAMYERITTKEVDYKYGLLWLGGKPYFNTLIFDLLMQPLDSKQQTGEVVVTPLNYITRLLKVNEEQYFNNILKNRIIVLGNFKTDLHETVYGKVAGPLILANIYEGLARENNRISFGWVLYLILSFSVVSYFLFYFKKYSIKRKISRNTSLKKMVRLLSFSLAIWAISLISFLAFHIHADVIVMIIYISLLQWLIRKWPAITAFLYLPGVNKAFHKSENVRS